MNPETTEKLRNSKSSGKWPVGSALSRETIVSLV